MNNSPNKYFLAANSCEGFISDFENYYSKSEDWRAYIIKGGPGTGKSSFMRKLACFGEQKGFTPVYCPCSSDPDSLDAVIFDNQRLIIFDGTPPHTVEPKNLGICESIVNLGAFLNLERLNESKVKILKVAKENQKHHKTAGSLLKAAGSLLNAQLTAECENLNHLKCRHFANKLFSKYIKGTSRGESKAIYLSGITPKGVVTNTEILNRKNLIVIKDDIGIATTEILNRLFNLLSENGIGALKIKNPFLPNKLIDGIIIESINLAIIREYKFLIPKTNVRKINAKRFLINKEYKHPKAFKKLFSQLLDQAILNLNLAKKSHDELEKCYIDSMDFNALAGFFEEFKKSIF